MDTKPSATTRVVFFPFNINERVRVKLNDRGRALCQAHHDAIFAGTSYSFEYRPKAEDKDGWSEWQLWELMYVLGSEVGMGVIAPFDTVIEFSHRVPVGSPDAT